MNLASRLQHEAPVGGVLLSFETYGQVREEILCEERGKIRVKGIAYPVAIYAAVAPKKDIHVAGHPVHTDMPHFRSISSQARCRPKSAIEP